MPRCGRKRRWRRCRAPPAEGWRGAALPPQLAVSASGWLGASAGSSAWLWLPTSGERHACAARGCGEVGCPCCAAALRHSRPASNARARHAGRAMQTKGWALVYYKSTTLGIYSPSCLGDLTLWRSPANTHAQRVYQIFNACNGVRLLRSSLSGHFLPCEALGVRTVRNL